MEIRLIKGPDIDKIKWNSCIHYASGGNIFGYKWYLDNVVKTWDALVEGEYESVFPLIKKKRKFKKEELYEHPLIRSTGLYSVHVYSSKRINAFLAAIPQEYSKVSFSLSEFLKVPEIKDFEKQEQKNHLIYLNQAYESISESYSQSLKGKLNAVQNHSLKLHGNIKPEKLAEFYKQNLKGKSLPEDHFHALQRIMYNCLHRGWGGAAGILNEKDELLAADFFIFSHGRVMSLMPAATQKGHSLAALEYLYDMQIRKLERSPLIFDFNTKKESDLASSFSAKQAVFYNLSRQSKFTNWF